MAVSTASAPVFIGSTLAKPASSASCRWKTGQLVVAEGARGERQPGALLDQRPHHHRVVVPLVERRVRRQAVEVPPALDVPHPHPLRALEDDVERVVVVGAVTVFEGDEARHSPRPTAAACFRLSRSPSRRFLPHRGSSPTSRSLAAGSRSAALQAPRAPPPAACGCGKTVAVTSPSDPPPTVAARSRPRPAPVTRPGRRTATSARFSPGPSGAASELARVWRIALEFVRGFRALHFVGPCVTVFGSARFAPATATTSWRERSASGWRRPASR